MVGKSPDSLFPPVSSPDPDEGLIAAVETALWFSDGIDDLAMPARWPGDMWPEAGVTHGQNAYAILRRMVLATPAVGPRGRAAKAAMAVHEMRDSDVRASGDLGGMAFLALAEDLIAAVI